MKKRKKVVIDIKNIALFHGGISSFIKPLLFQWIKQGVELDFILLGPPIDTFLFNDLANVEFQVIPWPSRLPRKFRHPYYDLVLFPYAVRKLQPDFIFTPYHDVFLPKGIPSIMMIHDTCIGDLEEIYPKALRIYYETMLKINVKRCLCVLTVSNSSKSEIVRRYSLNPDTIDVIPNSFIPEFQSEKITRQDKKHEKIELFYPGGVDFRKNIKRLVLSLHDILDAGYDVSLRITGNYTDAWERELKDIDEKIKEKIQFLGYLNSLELHNEYINSDVVVYPTLCEGFGRVCLEAMGVGAKLACSDIPVLHEVADEYAIYFNPFNIKDIAKKIILAHKQSSKVKIIKEEYKDENVSKLFIDTMKKYMSF